MPAPTIADTLKFANFQMAAESFLVDANDELKGSGSNFFARPLPG